MDSPLFFTIKVLEGGNVKGIGNTLRVFVRVSEQPRWNKFTSYARICVYMDISRELLEGLKLTWEEKECFQPLDYENILFRCRRCHEHGHLYRYCPLDMTTNNTRAKEDKRRGIYES